MPAGATVVIGAGSAEHRLGTVADVGEGLGHGDRAVTEVGDGWWFVAEVEGGRTNASVGLAMEGAKGGEPVGEEVGAGGEPEEGGRAAADEVGPSVDHVEGVEVTAVVNAEVGEAVAVDVVRDQRETAVGVFAEEVEAGQLGVADIAEQVVALLGVAGLADAVGSTVLGGARVGLSGGDRP